MPIPEAFDERLLPVLNDLVRSYGTPFHLYDEAGILATYRSMAEAFGDWPYRQHFAVKALPNPMILELLQTAGSGFDCSSPVELLMAQQAGASGDDIIFTSNNTTPEEYQAALTLGARITFDDVHYLRRAERLPDCVTFRVSPHGEAARSALMGHAGESKFGVPRDRVVDAYAEALARGVRRFGLYGMNCSNELDVGTAVAGARDLIALAVQLRGELGISFDHINFGGGVGIPYRPGEKTFDFARYAEAIRSDLAAAFPGERVAVFTECGRYVTGPHGVLITTVTNRLEKGREIAALDASMSALIRPALYPATAWHHADLPFAGDRPVVHVDLVGSMCENGDRFATAREMPEPREGDILRIHDTGAHGHAMGINYNGRLRPAELLLRANGDVVEIRRAESFADYVGTVRYDPMPISLSRNSGAETEQVLTAIPVSPR